MIYGIPNFKLEKEVVLRRWKQYEAGGIHFHLNVAIGTDITMAELRARHDAVFIATGVYKARDIETPGSGLAGIVPALDYLTASNRDNLGDAVPEFASGALDAKGKRVVVIGGGDTAMDCVRTAVRQGATAVTCLYRRDKANMPGSMREVKNAEEEGVEFTWLAAPEAFVGEGKVEGVRASRMHLGLPDATGRQQVATIAGSGFTIPCDLAIKALGFDPEDQPAMFGEPDLARHPLGHAEGAPAHHDDQPARRLRRRRHRPRRLPRRLGHPRRPRRRRPDRCLCEVQGEHASP